MTSTLTSKPTLNPVLRSFWTTQARNKVLYGGRSSSKSWDAAGIAIFLSNKYSLRFCCARQIQNKIEESVYTLLKIQIDRFGLRHRFRILNRRYSHAHVERLHQQNVQSIETSSLHLGLLGDMKRLNSLFCAVAYSVMEQPDEDDERDEY